MLGLRFRTYIPEHQQMTLRAVETTRCYALLVSVPLSIPRQVPPWYTRQLRGQEGKNQPYLHHMWFWDGHRLPLQFKPPGTVHTQRYQIWFLGRQCLHQMLLHCSCNLSFNELHSLAETEFFNLVFHLVEALQSIQFFFHYLPQNMFIFPNLIQIWLRLHLS